MADKEHPAAKAGRYVRAAGIVLGKEVDRRAAAAAARPAAGRLRRPLPRRRLRTDTFVGRGVFRFFVVSLVVLGLSLLHFDRLLPGRSQRSCGSSLAVILSSEAFLLITNWQQANERIGQRLLTRMWGPRVP